MLGAAITLYTQASPSVGSARMNSHNAARHMLRVAKYNAPNSSVHKRGALTRSTCPFVGFLYVTLES